MGHEDLTDIEMDVLNALSRASVTPSAVRLAAEVWARGSAFDVGDPVGLVSFVLSGLNERGLVIYREDKRVGLPYTVRLTPLGWGVCGFPVSHREVGRGWGRGYERHDGDRTDFRRHSVSAEGGPVIKEDFADHAPKYPDHDHTFIFGDDMGEPDMTRPYTRVTPDMLANVIEARTRLGPLATYAEIAEETGESARTVRYLLTKAPLLRRMAQGDETVAASLKDRIVHALEMLGPMKDATELRTILGHGDSDHDVVHVLHSLHKQGIVDFIEGRGAGEPRGIALRKTKSNGKHKAKAATDPDGIIGRGMKVEAQPHSEADLVDVTVAQADEATVPTTEFPLLRDLIQREENRQSKDANAMRYMEAAEILKDIDPESYASLMERAQANDVPFPSPIETEYLRYAKEWGPEDV